MIKATTGLTLLSYLMNQKMKIGYDDEGRVRTFTTNIPLTSVVEATKANLLPDDWFSVARTANFPRDLEQSGSTIPMQKMNIF